MPKTIGELITETCREKGLSDQATAKKLGLTEDELQRLKDLGQLNQPFTKGKVLDEPFLKRISGTLGIGYRRLIYAANHKHTTKFIPNFFTPDGTHIDEQEILLRAYQKDPEHFLEKLQSLL